jgi:hypothetical protein
MCWTEVYKAVLLVRDARKSDGHSLTHCVHLGLIFETSINFHPSTPRHIPEGNTFQTPGHFFVLAVSAVLSQDQNDNKCNSTFFIQENYVENTFSVPKTKSQQPYFWCHCLQFLGPMCASQLHTRISDVTNKYRNHLSSDITLWQSHIRKFTFTNNLIAHILVEITRQQNGTRTSAFANEVMNMSRGRQRYGIPYMCFREQC